jgi:hypothetical protein
MCLIILHNWSKPRKAKADIICYKTTGRWLYCNDTQFVSSLFRFLYIANVVYKQVLSLGYSPDHRQTVEAGFHSYSYKPDRSYSDVSVIGEFIIPKGSMYYFNNLEKEYCSDQIIFRKIIPNR